MHSIILALALAASDAGAVEPRKADPWSALAARLESDDVVVREAAAEALARGPERAVWKAVKPKLQSDSPEVRRAAVQVLRDVRPSGSAGKMTEMALRDGDAKVRREAVHALSVIDPERAIDTLELVALYDGDVIVRRAAVLDLGRIGTLDATSTLIDLLEVFADMPAAETREYFLEFTASALCSSTGQSLGTNLEGWRSWLERARTEQTDG